MIIFRTTNSDIGTLIITVYTQGITSIVVIYYQWLAANDEVLITKKLIHPPSEYFSVIIVFVLN
jgi:hypothetical protein